MSNDQQERADDVINGAIGHFIKDDASREIISALVYVRLQNAGYLPKVGGDI